MSQPHKFAASALAFFLAWTLATWLFEGRIETLLRPDATADRIIYAFAVNLFFGLCGGIILLRFWSREGVLAPAAAGFRFGMRTVAGVLAGFVLGLAAYVLQGAPSLHPVVLVNAFSQVLVVSAAEVVVCWSLVAVAVRSSLRARGAAFSLAAAIAVAALLFGLYHYAHSAPFNTLPMVALLSAVGVVTGAFFFISRDVAGTVVFHNFLGTYGVVQALAAADALAPLEQFQPALLFTAAMTVAVLAAGYAVLRQAPVRTGASPPARPARTS